MRLSDEQITKLQRLYSEAFSTKLTKEEALTHGLALARFVKNLAQRSNENVTIYGKESALRK